MSYPMKYIRDSIPEFEVPPYRGEEYEELVPDTLDIQERTALAVNGLTGPTDPEKDCMLYFNVHFSTNPPSMNHRNSDICQTKFEEALPLMRIASGSNLNSHVDPVWMATALRQIGPDGLAYWSYFPWVRYADWSVNYATGAEVSPKPDFYSVPLFCGRRIGAMTAYLLRDPSGPWDAEIRKIVGGLWSVAIDKGEYAYFPQGEFVPGVPRVRDAGLPVGIWSSLVGWTIAGLAQYHRASGYEPAVDLAAKLSRYLVEHGRYYGPKGELLPNYAGEDGGVVPARDGVQGFDPGGADPNGYLHFQHHMVPLLGVLDHALATGDRNLAEFVRSSFEWARNKGNVVVGYFPENIDRLQSLMTTELCAVAGMVGLAVKLSAAGLGDYWDDADRWIRNQFAEGQLQKYDWIYRLAERGLITGRTLPPVPCKSSPDPVVWATDRVPERNVGAFAGWSMPNDWYVGYGTGIMHCCTGNATRALYYIWENMLTFEKGVVSVNLLLNRPSRWADVHSHIPYTGQVDMRMKEDAGLRVRIPAWADPPQVRATIDGQPASVTWAGRYAVVGQVRAGAAVSLAFPIAERVTDVNIEKQDYILTLRGNEVVHIEPPGRYCPLYQRDHYRQDATRWKKAKRFVSSESIYW